MARPKRISKREVVLIDSIANALDNPSQTKLAAREAELEQLKEICTVKAFLDGEITLQEALFVEHYIGQDCNPRKAAKLAGYSSTLGASAILMKKPKIKRLLAERLQMQALDADEIVAKWRDISEASMEDFISSRAGYDPDIVDEEGNATPKTVYFIDLAKAESSGKMHLIKKLRETKDGKLEIELYDRLHVLDQMARHLNMFKEEIESLSDPLLKAVAGMSGQDRVQRLKEIDNMEKAI